MTSNIGRFPRRRMRRSRRDEFSRRLVREARLAVEDLILPVFVLEGRKAVQKVSSMPGVTRMSIDQLLKTAEQALTLGIPALALFPVIEAQLKTAEHARPTTPRAWCRARFASSRTLSGTGRDHRRGTRSYTAHGQTD